MRIDLSELFTITTIACLFIMFIEFLYSIKKRDGVYSISGTSGNILSYIIMNNFSKIAAKLYFDYFAIIFIYLGYTYQKLNILSFILCFIIIDFLFYFLHYLKHHINILWVLHSVHHGDNKLNMSTFLRASWLEQIIVLSIPILIPTLLNFNKNIIFVCIGISFIFQLLTHSQYIKFPHFMSYIFITPQLHAVHHDQKIENQNSNFGAVFSIWDRMFGTYIDKIDSFTPGIKGYKQDNFIMMQLDPIVFYIKNVFK